jgi:hypothetical protein
MQSLLVIKLKKVRQIMKQRGLTPYGKSHLDKENKDEDLTIDENLVVKDVDVHEILESELVR